MKKNNLLLSAGVLGFVLLFGAACGATDTYRKIRVEIPAYSDFRLDQFRELAVATFLTGQETAGLDLDKEVGDYFAPEFKRKFHGRVTRRTVSLTNEDAFRNPEFWQSLEPQGEGVLFLTGKASFSRDTRKAVLSRPGDPRRDELTTQRSIAERTVFNLEMTVYLIRAADGGILFQKTFKETRTYSNPRQRPDFAFYDLIQRVRQKVFRPLFGEESLQERYLLVK